MNSNHTTRFYNLMRFICDAGVRFHDLRTTATFVWVVFGLIVRECVPLNMGALFRPGKAPITSKERPFSRWLHNDRIRPMLVYRPLVEKALQKWAGATLYLALDTSQLGGRFPLVCLSWVSRGRALPVGWGLRHGQPPGASGSKPCFISKMGSSAHDRNFFFS